ncbi:MAG: hypothetical protein ACJATD_000908 [Alloalcanivorax sp.]
MKISQDTHGDRDGQNSGGLRAAHSRKIGKLKIRYFYEIKKEPMRRITKKFVAPGAFGVWHLKMTRAGNVKT